MKTLQFQILGLAALCSASLINATAVEVPDRAARMGEDKFGMFIHWGLYSELGRPVWVMNREKISIAEYEKVAARFNPVKFNADEWVKVAKDAGMKYMVITAKQHDGFAMFGSMVSPYNIVDGTVQTRSAEGTGVGLP
jgi:alpha-L-fucosidase